MRLLAKLTFTSTLTKIVIVLLFTAVLPVIVAKVAFESTNHQLRKQESKVLQNISANGMDYYLQGDSSYGSYTLLKEEYISLEHANSLSGPDTITTAERIIEGDTITYRILNRNFEFEKRLYNLEIGKSLETVNEFYAPLQRIAFYVLGSLILLTLITDLLYTRYLLRPLKKIIQTKVIEPVFPFRQNQEPVNTSTTDFQELDRSLLALMHRVNEDFNRERNFTSNASHELMTPIGILQNKMENLLLSEEVSEELQLKLTEMMKTLQRLKKIVTSLLLISRVENDQYARQDTVKPAEIVSEAIEELRYRIDDKKISVINTLDPQISIGHINKDLLGQLIFNIIHNAIRYNKVNGELRISDVLKTDNSYTLVIGDTGIGIEAEDIATIFERFKKKNGVANEGYGLGLAIVKAIADYHQLILTVNSEPGRGTRFSIVFPYSFISSTMRRTSSSSAI